jgi:hypothetical protein
MIMQKLSFLQEEYTDILSISARIAIPGISNGSILA